MKSSKAKKSLVNKILVTLCGLPLKRRDCAAIILAAGSGSRMGQKTAKQFLTLDGKPVLAHTLSAFEQTKGIDYVVVVTRDCDLELCREMVANFGFTKVAAVVAGGDTRQDSVLCGINAIDDRTDIVAIHDGARCLVTPEMITAVLDEARLCGAASAGAPVKNTIKLVDGNNRVRETPARASLWQAQTPQIFKAGLYRAAAYYAKKDGLEVTDDNSVIEKVGGSVTMVDCGYTNIKITTPEDIAIAEALLKLRKDEEK